MLDIQVTNRGTTHVVRLSGELKAEEKDRVGLTIGELVVGENAKVAIDLSDLQVVDSSGLSGLINLVTRARLSRGLVVLVAPSPFVAGVLQATRLDTWFDICSSLHDAEQRFREA